MIPIFEDTKVYVIAPARFATGGPELLHQFVYCLRNMLNIDASMYYIPQNQLDPVHPLYLGYKNPYTKEIEDSEKNILVLPEMYSYMVFSSKFQNIRKIIWWLSVDNFLISKFSYEHHILYFFIRGLNKTYKIIFRRPLFDFNDLILNYYKNRKKEFEYVLLGFDYHLVQSKYAKDFLDNISINNYYLSDFLNVAFLNESYSLKEKEDIVIYNYYKAPKFTNLIIQKAKDITFIPIKNMDRKQVIETLKRAKVYIDFGPHPGKDRLPREAAILGCCVITGKRGSAFYYEDVPILEEYKFDDKEENIPLIIGKIKDCLVNYEERMKDFENYREIIRNEPKRFIEDLKKIFVKVY